MTDSRPDPDELLDKIQREDARQQRGHFKLFFGSCAGVGKTFAMLSAAKAQQLLGIDVIIGVVETHGRRDTIAMTEGLESLPPQQIQYHEKLREEFDLDGALKRNPALILMDELAHSNIPGTRHQKRWQDVEELLAAGIDVYSTVNVQHLESLNDIVGQITGIRVWETIPDRVFDMADEVTLVDLPPDELLRRLKDGKVYIPHQAERASKNFFRKGNLIALRELALRRTADQVDAQMRDYRADQSIQDVWQAKERLLVCIGPHESSRKLVRSAARLASSLRADLIAVYIETPSLQKLSEARREAIHKTLKLAQELGAETTTLSGEKLAPILLSYAQSRNVTKLVIGKSTRPTWKRILRTSLADELASRTTDVDVYVVGHDFEVEPDTSSAHNTYDSLAEPTTGTNQLIGYLWAAVICIAVTGLTAGLVNIFDLANVIMVYLLAAVIVAIRFGRGPSIFTSFLSVASFDFFFVPPKFSFSVSDTQYLFTFIIMLAVSLTISNLTANFRYQARVASYRERRTNALNAMSKALSSALMVNQIIEISNEHLVGIFQSKIAILLPDSHETIRQPLTETSSIPENMDMGVAQWVYDNQQRAGLGTNTLPANPILYIPLQAPMRTRGVLAIAPIQLKQIFQPEQQQLLDTFASQIALALERIHYVEVAQDALINIEAERLRNSLLSAISHDLRTPLTALMGLSSTLNEQTISEATRKELIQGIHEEAQHMNSLIVNLLDMAKLQSGKVVLNKQWQPIDEVVGSALRICSTLTKNHQVKLNIADHLPLLSFDAVLIERVLCNLIENAVKYGRDQILISAELLHGEFILSVIDNGPGLPDGMGERIFDKFTRGEKESATHGVGLGLAICKAIVEAHQGKIWATNMPMQGAKISFTLPLGTPPEIESE